MSQEPEDTPLLEQPNIAEKILVKVLYGELSEYYAP